MKHAQELVEMLLDETPIVGRKAAQSLAEAKVYADEWKAAASVPRSGWQDWRKAGVQSPTITSARHDEHSAKTR